MDQLPDHLREQIAQYQGRVPGSLAEFRDTCFALLATALREANCIEVESHLRHSVSVPSSDESAIVQMLRLMSRDTDAHYRMRALCYLRLMGKEGRSFEELGQELGVVRATVHKCYRDLQKRLGNLPGRGDKSPAARETYRRNRLGKRRERGLCRFSALWHNASAPLLLLPAAA